VKPAPLKNLRVLVSITFLAVLSGVMLDCAGALPSGLSQGLLSLQILPSIVHLVRDPALPAALGVAAVLVLTMLFGRIYCSAICPLGTLQDIIAFLARKTRRHHWYRRLPPVPAIRYGILFLVALSTAAGMMTAVSLLDPFSNYGRVLAGLVRPALAGATNGAALVFEAFGLYIVYPVQVHGIGWAGIGIPALILGVIGWLAWTRGRFFCSTICPAGTLLGLISRFSLWKIRIDRDLCTGCSICARVCKAGCIDTARKQVDDARCVDCYNCLSSCTAGGITYARRSRTPGHTHGDESRRQFLLGSVTLAVGVARESTGTLLRTPASHVSTVPVMRRLTVAPPGAGSVARFTARCTACHTCVNVCPSGVLTPAFLEYGLAGLLQPMLDPRSGFCVYDCTRCMPACPSGALQVLASDEKKVTKLGSARFVKENCIVVSEGTECGACSEHCPTKAVRMVPWKSLQLPEVHDDVCIGCGACEHACPTLPWKAIVVDGRMEHGRAERPPRPKQEQPAEGEFPF
jgi:ferredoxin